METETSMHYDMGLFQRITENFDTRVALYCIDIDNYIVGNSSDSYHTASSYAYNLDEILFYGVELEFNSVWFDRLTVFGNYTYRETEYDEDDVLADAQLLEIAPKHKANLGLRFKLFEKTMVTSDIRYVGKRESEGDVYTLEAFTTTDIGIQQELFENASLRCYVNNVFGENYQEVYGYPMPDQVFGGSLKIVF